MSANEPPVFGPNGAVLNSPALGERLRADYSGAPLPPEPRPPETLWSRVWYRGLWLLLAVFSFFQLQRIGTQADQVLSGIVLGLVALAFLRSFWTMGPREARVWSWLSAGLMLGLFAAWIWFLSPGTPLWARLAISAAILTFLIRIRWGPPCREIEAMLWFGGCIGAFILLSLTR